MTEQPEPDDNEPRRFTAADIPKLSVEEQRKWDAYRRDLWTIGQGLNTRRCCSRIAD